ncbi:hypothetical protein [Bacillus sp. B15-48]|uniref:hypothetical protein n=1 Tax=Bacillus sp. B15-48 TaxID=1548601 RepID=UPI00193FAD3C|nr:hypothetical protein [Bacillus sp. B15-48]MBM4764621.1 hypothetical protein [Bacillus sp. B15-48]
MKRKLPTILLFLSAIIGGSFLLFIVKMIWFPPESMGMMMGRHMMVHHMSYWFIHTSMLAVIIGFIVLLVWLFSYLIKNKNR